ncbi:hypothetical protein PPROV_000834400 [Pycnococcus provasolii]|uniref:Uncharacterized protein n=1 Tax=Pycnococcus provasolii TaxID=41880 RepID=A0A830HXH2_9CHLO|nr:hypothetical protein PPROV_000834400 [Pycnococcus provasolii]
MPPPMPPPMPGEDCVCSMASSWDPSSSHSSLTEYLWSRELGGARGARGASSSSRVPYGSAGVPYGLAYARARAVLPFVFGSSLGGTPVVIRLSGAPCGFVASKGASTPAPSMQAAAPTQTQTLGAGRNVNAVAAGPTLTIQQQPVRNVQQPTLQQTAAVGAQTQTTRDVQANAVTANANGDNAATPTQTITMPAANRNQNGTITTTNQQQQTEGVLLQTTTQQTQTLRNAPPTVIPLPPTPTPPILQTLVDWSNAMVLAGFTTDGKYLVAHTAGSTNNAGATIALYEYIGGSWSGTNTTQKSDNDDDDDDETSSMPKDWRHHFHEPMWSPLKLTKTPRASIVPDFCLSFHGERVMLFAVSSPAVAGHYDYLDANADATFERMGASLPLADVPSMDYEIVSVRIDEECGGRVVSRVVFRNDFLRLGGGAVAAAVGAATSYGNVVVIPSLRHQCVTHINVRSDGTMHVCRRYGWLMNALEDDEEVAACVHGPLSATSHRPLGGVRQRLLSHIFQAMHGASAPKQRGWERTCSHASFEILNNLWLYGASPLDRDRDVLRVVARDVVTTAAKMRTLSADSATGFVVVFEHTTCRVLDVRRADDASWCEAWWSNPPGVVDASAPLVSRYARSRGANAAAGPTPPPGVSTTASSLVLEPARAATTAASSARQRARRLHHTSMLALAMTNPSPNPLVDARLVRHDARSATWRTRSPPYEHLFSLPSDLALIFHPELPLVVGVKADGSVYLIV